VTEERQTDATAGATNEIAGEPVISSGGQTVEEVEAFWRNRQSGTDRAHNAETAALKAQMEAMRAQSSQAPVGESPEAERVKALEAELQQERAKAQAAALRAEYPMTASVLGDAIANLPPEKIAAIEASYENGGRPGIAPMIDPNAAPRRQPGAPGTANAEKPLNEKTKDELLADLRRAAPMIQAEAREGIHR